MHKLKKLVVLSGAGISAESGLKTFRDSDGLWNGYDVYEVATPSGWAKNPSLVLDFYNARRQDIAAALPNDAHINIAQLEKEFDVTVITQNIDDLHERGGSTNVLHLHGEIFKMRSEWSDLPVWEIRDDIKPGDKAPDGGQLRPHIVWFEEPVPLISVAQQIMRTADIVVVIGTSLQVYPAAGLIDFAPAQVPKFVIDRKIPPIPNHYTNVEVIELPATEGVKKLMTLLSR